MIGWMKKKWKEQWVDHSAVKYTHAWSPKDNAFYIDSPLGLIKYKPTDIKDLTRFRNKYINRFDYLVKYLSVERNESDALEMAIANFYQELRTNEKVKFTANMHTRFKGRKLIAIQKIGLK
jgi:hypothetical protein